MNFFQQINELHLPGKWNLVIQSKEDGQFSVAVLFATAEVKDNAQKLVPPMQLQGTAEELDEHFFDTIRQPVQQASGLFHNINDYVKGLEDAQKQSKMEQDKKKAKALAKPAEPKDGIEVSTVPKPDKEEKRKDYEEAMKKVAELNDACKYAEALTFLPKIEDYPDRKTELEKKQADLERKREQYEKALTLFNA
ncbi:PRTRC system protein E [Mucilaginibacter corticis]|uniref:PRTRC system protein E n=1 Tax=Mucilaginibacter corticis TaxID=2597670 RepID=A0A556MM44_9SPHI|nr:PRTRC system protein E [Mucilaginibacter corticis]TSJ40918.1 PRTRC system protein E [Mucilaginibacter corticis]